MLLWMERASHGTMMGLPMSVLFVYVLLVRTTQALVVLPALNSRARATSFLVATRIQIETLPYIDPNYSYSSHRTDEYKERNLRVSTRPRVSQVVENSNKSVPRELNRRNDADDNAFTPSVQQSATPTPTYSPTTYRQPNNINGATLKGRDSKEQVVAAGVGTAAVGLMLTGPVGAMVLGFSAAYAAETKGGVVGDSARAVGEVALSAKNKAQEIDNKHHVVDSTVQAASDAWEKAKELDRQHKIVQKTKDVAIYGSTATVDFVREHRLVERSATGIVKGIGWLSERIVAGSLSGSSDLNDKPFRSLASSPETIRVSDGKRT